MTDTFTPMTAEPIHNGHFLPGNKIYDMTSFYLVPAADGEWYWSAYFKIDGRIETFAGPKSSSKAECLSDARAHGCAPSFAWMQAYYSEYTIESEAA